MQWKNVYAATDVGPQGPSLSGVDPQSPSLRGPVWFGFSPWCKQAKGRERDLVNELRDYETSGGDLDAIRQHIDDAASAHVWDMFLTNYKSFVRTG